MKFGWAVLLLFMGLAIPRASQAQASVYGEFSATELHNLQSRDFLYGGTVGLLIDGPTLGRHVLLDADIQGRFVDGNGESLNGATVGPRFSWLPTKRFGRIAPYGEFLVGFARFNGNAATAIYNGAGGSNVTTDSTIQINGGVTRQVSPHFDAVAEYSYAQYYAYGGEYNPKTFSVGAIFHFVKR